MSRTSSGAARRPAELRRAAALAVLAAFGSGALAGCAQQVAAPAVDPAVVEAHIAGHPVELQRLSRQVPLQGERNRALNQMRTGLAALELGRLDLAASSFDDALRIIEAIYAENPAAERARSVWYAESAKDFKGEAYERAMAYYYRGLVYLMQGDYQNARASFRGGLLQDSFMEENQRMSSDFGALAFLEGWAGRCAGFDAQTVNASFAEARTRNAALAEPPGSDTALMIFETGTGPLKRRAGSRSELLSYAPGNVPPVQQVSFSLDATPVAGVQAEDLFFQAATRSGRWVDIVNSGKVVYQNQTRMAGAAASAVGAGLLAASGFHSHSRAGANMAAAGAAVLLVGLVVQAAAEAMKTEADARQWDNLPANILVGTAARPQLRVARRGQAITEASLSATVRFERGGQGQTRPLQVHTSGACSIAWGREVSALSVADTAPNTMSR